MLDHFISSVKYGVENKHDLELLSLLVKDCILILVA